MKLFKDIFILKKTKNSLKDFFFSKRSTTIIDKLFWGLS